MTTASRRPLLAVVYDTGSASGATIRAAAGRSCDLLFVGDRNRPQVAEAWAGLAPLGALCDVTGLDDAERVRAVAEHRPAGIVTFSEYQLAETARLAEALGLRGHAPQTVALLTDKIAQRGAFAAAGVDTIRFRPLSPDPRAAIEAVGLPAVVKPRRGAGSKDTFRLTTAQETEAVLGALPHDTEFVVEELLQGDPGVAGAFFGDYVSVESVHTGTGSRQVCVTGKFRLAEPFRETGMLLPCSLSAADQDAVLAVDAAAVKALGVTSGVTHTEIKLTPDGPRVIEVNGRVGGYVPEILKRAAGVNLIRLAIDDALGLPVRGDLTPRFHGVTYQYFLAVPDDGGGTLSAVEGVDELAALPGVDHVEVHAAPGRTYDRQDGTQSHLGVVYGHAPDHAALEATVTSIDATFRPVFRSQPDRPTT
ncbi:ATP-grasp domain-containing protein [Streptomyces sp. NPDC001980]|uniref:ATP-grasp domain-containing protein n=1 Tax=Streptomyces sp. NPDC001980 TaxID=3157126 RepID=UPI00332CD8AE